MATPIRLIQRNKKVIELDAEKFNIKIGRGVVGVPIPVLGERFAADMNVVSVKIGIDGIIQDDDCSSGASGAQAATGFIDWSAPNTRDGGDPMIYFVGDGAEGGVSVNDLIDKPFYLTSTHQKSLNDGSKVTFKFISTGTLGAATFTGSHSVNGEVRISLNHANLLNDTGPSSGSFTTIGHEVATYLKNALDNASDNTGFVLTSSTHTSPSSQRLGHAWTATLNNGAVADTSRVDISQDETGLNGNSSTPSFWSLVTDSSGEENQTAVVPPAFGKFLGGVDSNCLSAGDKVQNLIANVANSNVMGAVGEIFQMDTNDDKKALVSKNFNTLDPTAGASDDYIIGLQIPYQSLIQSSTDTQHVARNFLMVTGLSPADHQGAAANTEAVGVEFDPQNVYTGIRGTVSSFSADYKGGDTFYTFSLSFDPIDMIVGL